MELSDIVAAFQTGASNPAVRYSVYMGLNAIAACVSRKYDKDVALAGSLATSCALAVIEVPLSNPDNFFFNDMHAHILTFGCSGAIMQLANDYIRRQSPEKQSTNRSYSKAINGATDASFD